LSSKRQERVLSPGLVVRLGHLLDFVDANQEIKELIETDYDEDKTVHSQLAHELCTSIFWHLLADRPS
jgi:hypothetical protein